MKYCPPRRLASALMTLMLVFALVPAAAAASTNPYVQYWEERFQTNYGFVHMYPTLSSPKHYTANMERTLEYWNESMAEEYGGTLNSEQREEALAFIPGYVDRIFGPGGAGGGSNDGAVGGGTEPEGEKKPVVAHVHVFNPGYTRTSHFAECSCGERRGVMAHTHDKGASCVCGYTFSTNATLTTLWADNMRLKEKFDPAVTEYTADLVSYKDVTKTRITAETFDALASVEISEDLSVNAGTNTYQIKVTAEDGTTTQIYQITVNK